MLNRLSSLLVIGAFLLPVGTLLAADHPCEDIHKACEAAGFVKGGHKTGKKGIWVDCVNKIRKGETVEGVNISKETVAACEAKKEKREAKKAAAAAAATPAK